MFKAATLMFIGFASVGQATEIQQEFQILEQEQQHINQEQDLMQLQLQDLDMNINNMNQPRIEPNILHELDDADVTMDPLPQDDDMADMQDVEQVMPLDDTYMTEDLDYTGDMYGTEVVFGQGKGKGGYAQGFAQHGLKGGFAQGKGYGQGFAQGKGYGQGFAQGKGGYGQGLIKGGYGQGFAQGKGYGQGFAQGKHGGLPFIQPPIHGGFAQGFAPLKGGYGQGFAQGKGGYGQGYAQGKGFAQVGGFVGGFGGGHH